MVKLGLIAAALISALVVSPALSADMQLHRHHAHRHHHRHYAEGPLVNYYHNYGPAEFWPDGSYANPDRVVTPLNARAYGLYDGHRPACAQSAATYRGQDGRAHPCN